MDHPLYLAMVIAVFILFGCVLGYVSFEETRARHKAEREGTRPHPEKVSGGAPFSK
jgi:hypothetical protein